MSDTGRVCLITGASRGIGKAIAEELGKKGCLVVGTATTENGAESLSQYLKSAGISGKGVVFDAKDFSSIEGLVKCVTDDFGPISILVNNAGIARDQLLTKMSEQDWDEVIDVDLKAAFLLTKTVARGMMKAKFGRIINISSVISSMGNVGQANYAAAKSGIEGFTRAIAVELARWNITANCIAPGYVETELTETLDAKVKEKWISRIPAGRFASPDEISPAVAFLASSSSGYITGTTLHVNGGLYFC